MNAPISAQQLLASARPRSASWVATNVSRGQWAVHACLRVVGVKHGALAPAPAGAFVLLNAVPFTAHLRDEHAAIGAAALDDLDADHLAEAVRGSRSQGEPPWQGATARFMRETATPRPDGGFFVSITLPPGIDTTAVREAAAKRALNLADGLAFFPEGGGQRSLRLPFCALTPAEIEEGIRRL